MEKLVYVVFEDCSDEVYNESMIGIYTQESEAQRIVEELMHEAYEPHFKVWFDEQLHDAYFYKAVALDSMID